MKLVPAAPMLRSAVCVTRNVESGVFGMKEMVALAEFASPALAHAAEGENVAIVSGNVHDHAVWTAIVRGWCREIDRSRFRLSIVYTDKIADSETDIARASVDRFIEAALVAKGGGEVAVGGGGGAAERDGLL